MEDLKQMEDLEGVEETEEIKVNEDMKDTEELEDMRDTEVRDYQIPCHCPSSICPLPYPCLVLVYRLERICETRYES